MENVAVLKIIHKCLPDFQSPCKVTLLEVTSFLCDHRSSSFFYNIACKSFKDNLFLLIFMFETAVLFSKGDGIKSVDGKRFIRPNETNII